MPANIPNMGAIHAVGSQFTHNVFKTAQSYFQKKGVAAKRVATAQKAAAQKSNVQMPAQPQKTMSPAPPGTGPLGPNAVAQGRARRQAKAPGYTPPGAPGHAAPNFGPANMAAGRNLQRGIGLKPPASTHAAPSFARSAPKHALPSFSSASASPSGKQFISRTPSGINESHPFTPAGEKKATAASTPTPSATSSAQFPQHTNPEGSSMRPLPNASAAHSLPGKPQTVSTGSRNIKSGGIAAMGSQLEAGLAARPLSLPDKKRRV